MSVMAVPPQNITLNPPEQIVMEVSSIVPLGFGVWTVGEERLNQFAEVGRYVGRVSIDNTEFASSLVISPTNYGDSGVYVFEDAETEFQLAPVNFYISLPPRPAEGELAICDTRRLKWYN